MERQYLYLENYTYLNISGKSAIVKNTLSDELLVFSDALELEQLRSLKSSPSGSIEIDSTQFESLINKLRASFSGDVITGKANPIQVNNALETNDKVNISPGKKSPFVLREIVFHINAGCSHDCHCESISKQYSHHCNGIQKKKSLSVESIKQWLEPYHEGLVQEIVLTGGNPLEHEEIKEILDYLRKRNFTTKISVHYQEADFLRHLIKNTDWLTTCHIELIIPEGFMYKNLTDIQNLSKSTTFTFLIESVEGYQRSLEFGEAHSIQDLQHFPIVKDNYSFFQDHLFSNTEDIAHQNISMDEITYNHNFNLNFINRLIVDINGAVFANLNFRSIGRINEASIQSIIADEMERDGAWKMTRHKVEPCANCHFKDLCPPISNYEYALNKFNTCNFIEDTKYALKN